jgi:hypothetical protein
MKPLHLLLLSLALLLFSCDEKSKIVSRPIQGQIEILNGNGTKGAASELREYLRALGYDVVLLGNTPQQNYKETIIVERTRGWAGIDSLKKDLDCKNIVYLENKQRLVDATLIVGRDIKEIKKHE